MYCSSCGKHIDDGARFCDYCGAKQDDDMTMEDMGNTASVPPVRPPVQDEDMNGSYGVQPGYGAQNTPQFQSREDETMQFSTVYPPNDEPYEQRSFDIGNKEKEPAAANNNKIVIITLASCVAVLLCLVGVMFFFMTKNNKVQMDDANSRAMPVQAEVGDNSDKEDTAPGDGPDEQSSKEESSQEEEHSEAEESQDESSEAEVVEDKSFTGLQAALKDKQAVDIQFVSCDVSNYPNVKTYFTVKDQFGNTVELNDASFAIQEKIAGGETLERTVKSFDQLKGREGVSFDLVADKSGSMSGDLLSMQAIMSSFVDTLDYNTGDSAELIAFDSYVMYMCTYTDNTTLLKNGIANMTTYGETALYDALYDAISNSKNRPGAKCVIAFTDGADNQSFHTVQEVIALANSCNMPIFIVGTYSGDTSVYSEITMKTGGAYWFIDSIYDLTSVLDTIYLQEKDMYCLEYVSDSGADPYARRQISCIFSDSTVGAQVDADFTPHEVVEAVKHDSRYEVIAKKCSWTEANAECISRGGHLVTITSEDEMNKVSKLAADNGLQYVWMGGYTSVKGGSAYGHWITGEPFDYQRWFEGEPSRTDHDGVDEMYLMLWNVQGGWSWNDQRNDPAADYDYFGKNNNMGFICEYEY